MLENKQSFKREELRLTHNAFKELESKLKRDLKDDYKGNWDMALYLANYYLKFYYFTDEYKFFTHYKKYNIFLEILTWLSHPYNLNNLNIKSILNNLENDLIAVKEKIYKKWQNDELKYELIISKGEMEAESNRFLKERLELKYQMIKNLYIQFPQFDLKRVIDFKEEIGL